MKTLIALSLLLTQVAFAGPHDFSFSCEDGLKFEQHLLYFLGIGYGQYVTSNGKKYDWINEYNTALGFQNKNSDTKDFIIVYKDVLHGYIGQVVTYNGEDRTIHQNCSAIQP